MPATAILDTVSGSALEVNATTSRKSRGVMFTGLDGTASDVLERCLAATNMPALGDKITVNGRKLYFRSLAITAVSSDGAQGQLIYDNDFPGTNSAYVITSNSYLQSVQTNMVPGPGRVMFKVPKWENPSNSADVVAEDSVTVVYDQVVRQVNVQGIVFGKPYDGQYEEYINYVNEAPFLGRDPGWWKITNGGTSFSKYANSFAFHLTTESRNTEDWSTYGVLQNKSTGRYVIVDDGDMADLIAMPYEYGIIGTLPEVVRGGFYQMTNFQPIFGFENNPNLGFGGLAGGVSSGDPSNT